LVFPGSEVGENVSLKIRGESGRGGVFPARWAGGFRGGGGFPDGSRPETLPDQNTNENEKQADVESPWFEHGEFQSYQSIAVHSGVFD
jgi:hypothetical protein